MKIQKTKKNIEKQKHIFSIVQIISEKIIKTQKCSNKSILKTILWPNL